MQLSLHAWPRSHVNKLVHPGASKPTEMPPGSLDSAQIQPPSPRRHKGPLTLIKCYLNPGVSNPGPGESQDVLAFLYTSSANNSDQRNQVRGVNCVINCFSPIKGPSNNEKPAHPAAFQDRIETMKRRAPQTDLESALKAKSIYSQRQGITKDISAYAPNRLCTQSNTERVHPLY